MDILNKLHIFHVLIAVGFAITMLGFHFFQSSSMLEKHKGMGKSVRIFSVLGMVAGVVCMIIGAAIFLHWWLGNNR